MKIALMNTVQTVDIVPVIVIQVKPVLADTNGKGWKVDPRLKYEVSYAVDCHDLDKFVANQLVDAPVTWRSLDTGYDGYHNGSYVSATVEIGADIEDDLDQDFNRWLTGEGPFYTDEDDTYSYDLPGIQHVLQWLGNMGKIPEGKYVVELWW